MKIYRTIPVTVQAVQWWKHGDSPHVYEDAFGAFVLSPKGSDYSEDIHLGDWIVTHPNGSVEHVPQADFAARFEEHVSKSFAYPNPL